MYSIRMGRISLFFPSSLGGFRLLRATKMLKSCITIVVDIRVRMYNRKYFENILGFFQCLIEW